MEKHTPSEDMEYEVCEILGAGASLGFNELLDKVRKLRRERGQLLGSSATLSATLKNLQGTGIVLRDFRSRTYSLTKVGLSITPRTGEVPNSKPNWSGTRSTLLRRVEIAQRDLVSFLADALVHALEMGGGKRIELSGTMVKQVTNQLSRFADGKRLAITALWSDVVADFVNEFSTLLSAFMLMEGSMLPGSMERENLAATIQKATAVWSRFRSMSIQRTLSSYLANPEVLAALDQAIKDGKFNNNLVEAEYEQIHRQLRRQRYL